MSDYEKRNKCYLEVVRIIAMFLVMYNHSPAYTYFKIAKGVQFDISLFLSIVCKAAVPLFLMISGAVLLGKNEGLKSLFNKRILKCAVALVLFSALYALKLVIKGEEISSVFSSLTGIVQEPIFLPYWYLYSYLGFLVLLPILRPLAQNMQRKTVGYLVFLSLIFQCVLPVTGYEISGFFNISPIFANIIFYPILGYGIDQHISGKEFWNWKGIIVNFMMVPIVGYAHMMMMNEYAATGEYTEAYLARLTVIPTMLLFLDLKMLVQNEKLSEKMKKAVSFIGDKVFGIYLLEGTRGVGGWMDFVFRAISPFCGFIFAYIIEIYCVFMIRLALVTIMKKMPGLKRIL